MCKAGTAKTVLIFAAMIGTAIHAAAETQWPTLHRDGQRSGYTDEVLHGPLERKWYRSFVTEQIGARVEAIVANGLCFVGTYAGNVYALDIHDGQTVWQVQAGGQQPSA